MDRQSKRMRTESPANSGVAIWKEMQLNYEYLSTILNEFHNDLIKSPEDVIESDAEWFRYTELKFLVSALKQTAFMELAHSSTKPDDQSTTVTGVAKVSKCIKDRVELTTRWNFMEKLLSHVIWLGQSRLETTKKAQRKLPRVFRLAEYYKLSAAETELFQLLVVYQGCQTTAFRCHMLEEDIQRKMLALQRLAKVSEIDVEDFHQDEREHVKEGTLIVDDEHYGINLRLTNIAVRVLLGRKLTNNQMLKVSQTGMEVILKEEGLKTVEVEVAPVISKPSAAAADPLPLDAADSDQDTVENDSAYSFIGKYKERSSSISDIVNTIGETKQEFTAYSPENQLDYLEDRFQVVAFAIRASGARVKDQMKAAGTKQPWDSSSPATAGRRELKAKQRLHARRVEHRLSLTRKDNVPLPRLEEMSLKFKLNNFEQNVIVMLIGKTVSPVIKNLIDNADTSPVQRMDDSTTINQILSVLCDTFQQQVAHRVYFYKSSRLLSRGLIKLHRGRWHSSSGDLVDQRVELDRRVLDWVVGLDTEINELVEGSDLYSPKVNLEQVVLPPEHKHNILETVESYEKFCAYRKKHTTNETITYGAGLVMLLCGASGTGKTMTANAIAHYLNKRVLLVDFPSLQGKKQDADCDADLRGLFREAEMSNAILFFDECESIFKQREFGGDRLLNSLLSEMERYEGIVFLATNRPFDLDEAMHRRITSVFEFKPPDHMQRKKIWKSLLKNNFEADPNINWDMISLKYELSGGFIKNAIVSALLKAISRNATKPVITEQDIVAGCSLQMRGALHMKTFDHRVVPTTGLDHMILPEKMKKKLSEIVQFEKARGVIYGQWGFDFGEPQSKQRGITALLSGPPGVGKLAAAKAVGFEVGRPLKVVNFAQLQHDTAAATRKAMRAVFDDARLMDAVLVLEGFETFGSHLETAAGGSSPHLRIECSRLMDLMESFPGIVLLIADQSSSMSSMTLHPVFAERLTFIIQFKVLNSNLRAELWKSLFPSKAPIAKDVDFKLLGERFELSNSSITNAVFRAAATAAFKSTENLTITMKDIVEAAEVEKKKMNGDSAMLDRLFV